MQSHLLATWAVLLDFHLFSMLTLVSCTDVVFFTTFTALKCNIVSWHCLFLLTFFAR